MTSPGDVPIPLPELRQVHEVKPRRRRREIREQAVQFVFRPVGTDRKRTVGFYYPQSKMLVKHITPGQVFGNKPGIAWNAEMLAMLDRKRPRPVKIVVHNDTPLADDSMPKPYRVPWTVARAFALAALVDGDERWLIEYDYDTQILIPWPAWRGQWVTPPPPDPEEEEDPEPVAEQAVLLDLPPDPPKDRRSHLAKHGRY